MCRSSTKCGFPATFYRHAAACKSALPSHKLAPYGTPHSPSSLLPAPADPCRHLSHPAIPTPELAQWVYRFTNDTSDYFTSSPGSWFVPGIPTTWFSRILRAISTRHTIHWQHNTGMQEALQFDVHTYQFEPSLLAISAASEGELSICKRKSDLALFFSTPTNS